MATVSYTIYSHYDPPEKKAEKATLGDPSLEDDLEEDSDEDVEWPDIRRKLAPPPIFVPATGSQDIDTFFHPSQGGASSDTATSGRAEEIAGWYRSLTAKPKLDVDAHTDESGFGSNNNDGVDGDKGNLGASTKNSAATSNGAREALSISTSGAVSTTSTLPRVEEARTKLGRTSLSDPSTSFLSIGPPRYPRTNVVKDKNNWFIMKVLQSQSPSFASSSKIVADSTSGDNSTGTGDVSTSTSTVPPEPLTSTLADILARDPPPLPHERKYEPPIWLAIGPSNKGFEMLEKSGWREGEPLGPDFRRPNRAGLGSNRRMMEESETGLGWETEEVNVVASTKAKGKGKERDMTRERIEVKLEDEDIVELKDVDIIDLTLSDDEDTDDDSEDMEDQDPDPGPDDKMGDTNDTPNDTEPPSTSAAYERKALIVPIGTVLKSDRLGIGLKAKTVGPYKASKKRITHNSAALTLHMKAAEEARKRKETVGRGRRGFARQYKNEQEKRQRLWAYLNS